MKIVNTTRKGFNFLYQNQGKVSEENRYFLLNRKKGDARRL